MKKKLVSVLAGLITLVAITTASAHAGSTVNGNLNGYPCHGSVTYGSNYASATTTFGRGNSQIYAHATVLYCSVNGNPVVAGYAAASEPSHLL